MVQLESQAQPIITAPHSSPAESIHSLWAWLLRHVLLATPAHQNTLILGSSALLIILVLSGALLYRQYDPADQVRRGEWYMKQGKAVLATHQLERLVRNHPNNYEGYFMLGRAYYRLTTRIEPLMPLQERLNWVAPGLLKHERLWLWRNIL